MNHLRARRLRARFRGALRSVWDRVLLLEAERTVRRRTPAQQEAIRRYFQAAANRLALADASTDPWYAAAALALHRVRSGSSSPPC